jgi:hypothetical protein
MPARWMFLVTLLTFAGPPSGAAQSPGRQARPPASSASLALSPGVVLVKSQPGVSSTHPLTMTNLTQRKVLFALRALDVIVREGKRVYVPAGETEGGIARSAVFDPATLALNPGESGQVKVTLTVPKEPRVRAVVALFEGRTAVSSQGSVMVTGSLGTLITYNLSDRVAVRIGEPSISPQTESSSLTVSEPLENSGSEPVVTHGTLAILRVSGELVGRVSIEPHRLLPGEKFDCPAAYTRSLAGGRYRAMMSLEHEGGVQTRTIEFTVP